MRCLRSLQRQLVHFLICGAVLGLYTSLNQNYSPNTAGCIKILSTEQGSLSFAGTALPGTTTEQSRRSRNEIVHDQVISKYGISAEQISAKAIHILQKSSCFNVQSCHIDNILSHIQLTSRRIYYKSIIINDKFGGIQVKFSHILKYNANSV